MWDAALWKPALWNAERSLLNKVIEKLSYKGRGKEEEEEYSEPQCKVKGGKEERGVSEGIA